MPSLRSRAQAQAAVGGHPAPRQSTKGSVATASPTPALDRLLDGEPDLVDRIFDYVLELVPEIAGRRAEIKGSLREEFGAQEAYVRRREYTSQQLEAEVERLLQEHGCNVYAVARILDIAPGTVYRKIKAAGGRRREIRNLP